jgi:hypothetical protein
MIKMRKELYWLDEAWPGKLAVAPRPRGGDWLKDDVANWKRANVNAVLSLLTPDEEKNFDLHDEAGEVRTQGMDFTSFPIPDRQIPRSESKLAEVWRESAALCRRARMCSFTAARELGAADWWQLVCL